MEVLREAVGWLPVLLSLAAVIVCAFGMGRSRWAWLLLGGFVLETAVLGFYRASSFAMSRGVMDPARLRDVFLMFSVVGALARAIIIGGIAGVLFDPPASRARSVPPPRPA
jgi:hypothetical protein